MTRNTWGYEVTSEIRNIQSAFNAVGHPYAYDDIGINHPTWGAHHHEHVDGGSSDTTTITFGVGCGGGSQTWTARWYHAGNNLGRFTVNAPC